MVFPNHADATSPTFVMAEEKITVHDAPVAVAQREHSGAIEKSVGPKRILARFVRDDFQFTIAAFEQVVFHERAGIGHRLMAVAHANRFSAIASERRPMTKVIAVNPMKIRLPLDF